MRVRHNEREVVVGQRFKGRPSGFGLHNPVVALLQLLAQRPANEPIVLHDQDA
jgi:hypothetical protein